MQSKREVFIFLLLFVIFSHQVYGMTQAMFSDDELTFFASLGLCEHFGGVCGSVCPFRFIKHKWGVPLCQNDSTLTPECCIGPAETEKKDTEEFITTVSATTQITSPTSPAPECENCGHVEGRLSRKKRIVGGQVASPKKWPWLVAFRSMLGSHACSGAVIAQRWIITAAHCFKYVSNPSLWRVRIGEYDLLLQEDGERDLQVEEIIMHPGYRARGQTTMSNQTLHAKYVHDIALVRLSQDTLLVPICLPSFHEDSFINNPENKDDVDDASSSEHNQQEISNEIESSSQSDSNFGHDTGSVNDAHKYNEISNMGFDNPEETESNFDKPETLNERETCWVAGWGTTLDATIKDQVLREVSGNLVGSEECSQMWGEQLEGEMLCFGDGTYGPCAGDSGGPLACQQDGKFYLTGVVSWGTEDCNVSGYPSVFTNTRPYMNWIRMEMGRRA